MFKTSLGREQKQATDSKPGSSLEAPGGPYRSSAGSLTQTYLVENLDISKNFILTPACNSRNFKNLNHSTRQATAFFSFRDQNALTTNGYMPWIVTSSCLNYLEFSFQPFMQIFLPEKKQNFFRFRVPSKYSKHLCEPIMNPA